MDFAAGMESRLAAQELDNFVVFTPSFVGWYGGGGLQFLGSTSGLPW